MSIQSQYLYRPYTKEEIEKDLIGAQLPQTLPPIAVSYTHLTLPTIYSV